MRRTIRTPRLPITFMVRSFFPPCYYPLALAIFCHLDDLNVPMRRKFAFTDILVGTIVNFYGSLNAPGIHGYPNASYTIQPNNLVPLTYFNSSGAVRPVPTSYLNVSIPNVEMFKSGKFAEGNYTLTVRTVGVSPGGPTFYFDYLAVQCGDDTFTEYVILDDNDQQWDYEGTWITGNKTGEYRNTMHVTPKSGGSVSLGFHG